MSKRVADEEKSHFHARMTYYFSVTPFLLLCTRVVVRDFVLLIDFAKSHSFVVAIIYITFVFSHLSFDPFCCRL